MMQTARTVWNTISALWTASGDTKTRQIKAVQRVTIVAVEKQYVFHILSVCL
jgi:hypothetical protein